MAHSSPTGSETVQHVATGSYIFLFNQMLTEPAIQMRFPGAVADIDSIYFPATTPEFLGYLRDQRSMRVPAGTDANGRKAFCQSGLSAEITFICHFSDRVKVANPVRANANAITAADALRFFYPHDPLLITPRRPCRANVDARSIFAVLT